jgi:hypothetical protein
VGVFLDRELNKEIAWRVVEINALKRHTGKCERKLKVFWGLALAENSSSIVFKP